MNNTPSPNSNDWKNKYLDALDQQESQERQHQQVFSLLVKALLRISVVAEGIDNRLDKQMGGMRQILRDTTPSTQDLNTVVAALEGQVKQVDIVKSERSKAIADGFQQLTSQLKKIKPRNNERQQLQRFDKTIKNRSERIQEYSLLVNEFAKIQQAVLDDPDTQLISKPFWHQWVNKTKDEGTLNNVDGNIHQSGNEVESSITEHKTEGLDIDSGLNLADDNAQPRAAITPDDESTEPPFSRLNEAVCEILIELLNQIEAPPSAKENYAAAKAQITKGLNWYELVPTLEDISIVIISAFDRNQLEFEEFLTQLNERILQVQEHINNSEQTSEASKEANRRLNETMHEQIGAMQQSVENATGIDQLKSEISSRLEQVVSAMDQHQTSEKLRESSLLKQLEVLVDQVESMELATEQAEERIEEQRQIFLRDVLTQLPNRGAYQQRLSQEFERWQRYKRPLTMIVCDVDYFKKVNDNYGHLAGDKVLRIIAKTLRTRLRKTDFIARFGGEEFVILMPETEQEQALKVAEGVREAIASCPFHFKEQPVSITTSFGIAGFFKGDTSERVFSRADRALYQAKEEGRNRCVVASEPAAIDNEN